MEKIKAGIVGYGNLGKGAEKALKLNDDFELVGIFTRREPSGPMQLPYDKVADYMGKIDVMLLCGGSATDLWTQGPYLASLFNTIDTFDNHGKIPAYYAVMNEAAEKTEHVSLISIGWDPGLFSLNRLLGQSVLTQGEDYTFWGKGVSQGHSDALRRIRGVKNAIQYTIPVDEAMEKARNGQGRNLKTREKHTRLCYIVAAEDADLSAIEKEAKEMPNYFADYDTTVHFVSEETLQKEHGGMPHGGFVIRTGRTGENTNQRMEFQLSLDSNPEFTSSVLVAYARALYRMHQGGAKGARTIFDVPPAWLSGKSNLELLGELL